jgi:flagellar protein FliS
MNQQAAQNYLKTRVLTATPEQLQLMLYDGALRFGEQAKLALQAKNYEQSCTMILRMQKIVAELTGSLKPDVHPELCARLAALYNFIYRKLIDANMRHHVESLEEAMQTLRFQRDTWALLLEDLARKKAADAAAKMNVPAPSAQMEASISTHG